MKKNLRMNATIFRQDRQLRLGHFLGFSYQSQYLFQRVFLLSKQTGMFAFCLKTLQTLLKGKETWLENNQIKLHTFLIKFFKAMFTSYSTFRKNNIIVTKINC